MTLTDLYQKYKENIINKKIILCNWKSQEGFEINSLEEFEQTLFELENEELYLINGMENETIQFFEYFIMKQTLPYVVVLRHPFMTNGYFKELPDKMNDMFVSQSGGIYRYLTVDYAKNIKEYVIEFPQVIDAEILEFCSEKMRKGFKNSGKNSSISLLLTNSSRFIDLNPTNFVMYELESIYTDWDIKKITTLNLSRKLWKDIKELGSK